MKCINSVKIVVTPIDEKNEYSHLRWGMKRGRGGPKIALVKVFVVCLVVYQGYVPTFLYLLVLFFMIHLN